MTVFDASMFSVYDAASRFVLEKYPPDVSAAAQGKTGGTLRILLIGFGDDGGGTGQAGWHG